VLVIDEVGYLTYGPDAANVLFHVVNDRHLRKRPMIFTTNKPLNQWGQVLHDEDMAAAILDRVLERGRFIHLDGPSGRTRHLNLEEILPAGTDRARISGTHMGYAYALARNTSTHRRTPAKTGFRPEAIRHYLAKNRTFGHPSICRPSNSDRLHSVQTR
jgi:IstB-like ATP binding protein